ncbi:cobalamin biosynthesis protein CobW [Lentzea aerocolonigenes]|uniref:Cobalamin biosynthesis protein CobW n=1 Tax=Lentzea aerocolonigenes TaxID=68170 RepID=A0A0F0GCZ9_LENAE|nr:GTP-binding protein [Lentzea aerocolonigenes]KJK34715.1 cobalamin biosynthesis protein CobW [Lentzea aerocolonigenes]
MGTEVVLVAGLTDHHVADEIWRRSPDSALVRHDLSRLAGGTIRRWVDGVLTELELAHGCVSCTLRLDLLPLLEELNCRVIVHLDPVLEPEAVCFALAETDIRVDAVVTVVDRATWLADATGEDTLAERGMGAADSDERTVAQVVVGQAEFADALVLAGDGDPVLDAVLDRLNPLAPRQDLSALDVPALFAAIPANARRGGFDDGFGSLLYGGPSLEPAHGVSVVHFAKQRPFHPMRLHGAMGVLLDDVVRARGRVWMASQRDEALWLESAGRSLRVGNLGSWRESGHGPAQELVVITTSPEPEKITTALAAALVTDEELALIDELEFADPFTDWREEE